MSNSMYKKLALGIIAGLIISAFFYFSPILEPFPKPTGIYSIGTTQFYFTDEHRLGAFTPKKQERTVRVRLWYPTSTESGEHYQYLGDMMPVFQQAFADEYKIPRWLSRLLWRKVKTHAFVDAPIATEQAIYPVILFSHGLLGSSSEMYVSIIENLASHGYIVAAIDHPYLNWFTKLPDGTIASSIPLGAQFEKMSPHEQRAFQSKGIEIFKADMKLVVDQLTQLNQNAQSIFYGHLDLDKIGVMGHSAGGTAAIEFCRSDNSCKAAVDLDGWYDHVIGHEPINKPLLLLFGSKSVEIGEPTDEYLKRKEITREQYFQREQKIAQHRNELCTSPQCTLKIIEGAGHGDFGDQFKWPLRSWNEISANKLFKIINSTILEFFNNHLTNGAVR